MKDYWSQFEEIKTPKSDYWSQFEEIKNPVVQQLNIQPTTDEQKVQAQELANQIQSGIKKESIPLNAVAGSLEGIRDYILKPVDYGVSKIASGLTLGLSDKISPIKTEEPKSALGKGVGIGLEILGGIPTGAGIYKGVSSIPKISKVAMPVASAVEGFLTNGIKDESLESALEGGALGGTFGSVLQLGKYGTKILPEIFGLTTGAGSSSIKQAVDAGKRGSKSFLRSMRKGAETSDEIIDLAERDFKELGQQNYAKYKSQMDKIGQVENVELKPIKDTFDRIVQEESGGKFYLVDDDTKKVIYKVSDMLDEFSKDTKRTLQDFDDFKRAVGKISPKPEAGNAKKVQGQIYNAIKGEIEKQAPVYSDIMKESADGLEKLTELKKTFSLGKKSSGDTVLRKLQSTTRNNVLTNYGKRQELLKELPHGQEIADRISGQTLNALAPRGLEARTMSLLGGGASLGGAFNPAYLISSSPRVVGELAYKSGQLSRLLKPAVGLSILQTGLKEKE
jgi:hypothetical protein